MSFNGNQLFSLTYGPKMRSKLTSMADMYRRKMVKDKRGLNGCKGLWRAMVWNGRWVG